MNHITAFIVETKKEIIMNAYEGTVSNAQAAAQLQGLDALCAVILADSKSVKLKEEITAEKQNIETAIAKLSAE
jgi:hypothetical protein